MPKAVIIAGGPGTRAHGMTKGMIPKALLPIAGVPIIFRQIRTLADNGIGEIAILGGHMGNQLQDAVMPEAERLGITITFFIEKSPLGTAGALPSAESILANDDCLVVYGDIVFDVSIKRLLEFHKNRKALATIAVHPNNHPETSDLVVADDNGRISAILPMRDRPRGDYRNLVPAAFYMLAPEFFGQLENGVKADFIHDVFPRLIQEGHPVYAYATPEYLRDIGTPERNAQAAKDVESGLVARLNRDHLRSAVFLDCDGVLNHDPNNQGVCSPDDLSLMPGAGEAVSRINKAGALAVAVSNKPQVAKGFLDNDGLQAVFGRLETLLARDGGVLDKIYYCPHHPESGFDGEVAELKIECDCRKPAPGMILKAMQELPIDRARSAIIGDTWRDIGVGRAARIYAYGVRTGEGCRIMRDGLRPDLIFTDIVEAVRYVLNYEALCLTIVDAALSLPSPGTMPKVISVCGRSRSGKSCYSHALFRSLCDRGMSPLHVRLDDWIVPESERTSEMSAHERNRIALYPEIIDKLRNRNLVEAPGYDANSRGPSDPVSYDPANADIIILDGLFSGHQNIRDTLDMVIFTTVGDAALKQRHREFYGWKGFTESDIESLLSNRMTNEWPMVDSQQKGAEIVVNI